MSSGYQKYKTNSVQTASREKILLMLYEGAIKFTKLAIKGIEEKKIADKGYYIGRAYDIIMELNNTLDHRVGGEISKNLEQLYIFIMEQYTKANFKNDKVPLENSLKVLENLYQGWQGAIEKIKTEAEKQK